MTTPVRAPGSILSTVLWGVQLFIAVLAIAQVYFRRISIPHCDLQCDFALLDLTGNLFAVLALCLFALVGVLQTVLPGPSRWWLPSLGIVLTLLGAFTANAVSDAALLLE